jgi:hypothetical protein
LINQLVVQFAEVGLPSRDKDETDTREKEKERKIRNFNFNIPKKLLKQI